MRKILWIVAFAIFAFQLRAQTNGIVRLAMISESEDTAAAIDILTADFSDHTNLQLLERNEIQRIYREQALSPANGDYLKLGQLLGADGLLLLKTSKQGTNQILNVRLVATKPGVVLSAQTFSWPITNMTEWSGSLARHLDVYIPKLAVAVKDAIPLSIVNLRSAVGSAEGRETERAMKVLTIQRLTREPQFFILERQRLELLAEEKTLKSDDSSFWNGSYPLEGVIDQNGYSRETVTVNVRMTPPKGGVPVLFEIKGSRTNLAEVVNQLAAKVNEALKINSAAPEWNAADEAKQYFNEAQWALKWGDYGEAQQAAESAWALGKNDVDCALARVKSYIYDLPKDTGKLESGEWFVSSPGFDANGKPLGPPPSDAEVQADIKELKTAHPFGVVNRIRHSVQGKIIEYTFLNEPPDPKKLDCATRALELYYEFSCNSPDGEPKVLWRGPGWSDWHNSDWYQAGIDGLTRASRVLQWYYFSPESRKAADDKLAGLRKLARSVAALISKAPTVHDSYFVGDRLATHDELATSIEERPTIFRCEVDWGCFWQETPEDEIALYRELMSGPVFSYIHENLWLRSEAQPRLVAWNESDANRLSSVWDDFQRELNSSTNIFLQLEAAAFKLRDSDNEETTAVAFTNFFKTFFDNRDVLVGNNVEVVYLGWGTGRLVQGMYGGTNSEFLRHIYETEYGPKIDAMEQEYWNKTVPAFHVAEMIPQQKEYLRNNTPFDFMKFINMFPQIDRGYSTAQASELLPLILSYKSNLVAQSTNVTGMKKMQLSTATTWVNFLLNDVNHALNPPQPKPPQTTQIQIVKQQTPVKKALPAPVIAKDEITPTNVLPVKKFMEVPIDGLQGDNISGVTIRAHHWVEGKLLLDLQYSASVYAFDVNGNWHSTRNVEPVAFAILDPKNEQWNIVSGSAVGIDNQNMFYHHSVLLDGKLFTSNAGEIRKYDFDAKQWETLPVSDGNNYELFSVNGNLFAAGQNIIFEITDGGKSTRILASNRRQPPVSLLDAEELGTPTLFEGPAHSLRLAANKKIYTWAGTDWREDATKPASSSPPQIFTDGAVFRQVDEGPRVFSLSLLPTESNDAQLCLWEKMPLPFRQPDYARPGARAVAPARSHWNITPEKCPVDQALALHGSDLYFLRDHCDIKQIVDRQNMLLQTKVIAKNGYNVSIQWFAHDLSKPENIYLNFESPDAYPPVAAGSVGPFYIFNSTPPPWMLFTPKFVFFGLEHSFFQHAGPALGTGNKPGVWAVPVAQFESFTAELRKTQLAEKAKSDAEAERKKQDLLTKYDTNHDGVIDVNEREEALDDPAFIESELETIDTNQNGWLDAGELAYFDANKNKTLEPKEAAGIDIVQHLFAERLLKKYDENGDGLLDRQEFDELERNRTPVIGRQTGVPGMLRFPDENRDGFIDLTGLEAYIKQELRKSLRVPRQPGDPVFISPVNVQITQSTDPKVFFKMAVEYYWRNPDKFVRRQQIIERTISPTGEFITNSPPKGANP